MPEAMENQEYRTDRGRDFAESGIRTFAPQMAWEEHRVEDAATPEGFDRDPELVQTFYGTPVVDSCSSQKFSLTLHNLALAKLQDASAISFAGDAEYRQSA